MISIIIPVYNVANYIEQTLVSALSQTYHDIEYIIVDDCGTDESMEIIEQIKKNYRDKNIRIVKHSKNKGLSGARNTGLAEAIGEYVFFMDADDTITPECIEKHFEAITYYDADVTDACFEVIGGRNVFKEVQQTVFLKNKLEIQSLYFNNTLHISACNKLIKTAFLRDRKLFFTEGLTYEDLEWTLLLTKNASSIVLLPDKTYNYYIHGNSIINSFSARHIESTLYLNQMYLDYIDQCQNEELKKLSTRFLTERRFKISLRIIISSELTFKSKSKYYFLVNAGEFRRKRRGMYGFFTQFPFELFFIVFYLPRKWFTKMSFKLKKMN